MNIDSLMVLELNEELIASKIYIIRGQKVMLDFELAEIYGYETKNFNRQVKNNNDKFNEYFMFQLSKEEYKEILRCKNFTSSWIGKNILLLLYIKICYFFHIILNKNDYKNSDNLYRWVGAGDKNNVGFWGVFDDFLVLTLW